MNIDTHRSSAHAVTSSVGVLLVHGLNGDRGDMAELTAGLAAQGFVTENILLPGHEADISAMLAAGWDEWAEAVHTELLALQARCEQVFLVGHSLGGALCLHVAASIPVAGIVTMCAPIMMHPSMLAGVRLIRRFTHWESLPSLREDIHDPVARRIHGRKVYRPTPMAPVESMLQYLPLLRAELPRVTAPILIMVAIHDHVVPARDGRIIYSLIGSREKSLVSFQYSYHVITKDHERAEVLTRTLTFIQQHLPAQGKPSSPA